MFSNTFVEKREKFFFKILIDVQIRCSIKQIRNASLQFSKIAGLVRGSSELLIFVVLQFRCHVELERKFQWRSVFERSIKNRIRKPTGTTPKISFFFPLQLLLFRLVKKSRAIIDELYFTKKKRENYTHPRTFIVQLVARSEIAAQEQRWVLKKG